jgi:hypothetical protein
MMRRLVCVISVMLTGLAPLVTTAGEKAEEYLKDDKLKERFEVQVLMQAGFGNYGGTYYVVEPDGAWSTGVVDITGKKEKPKTEGKLTSEQLNKLAQTFANNDLDRLPPLVTAPTGGPRMTIVTFGPRSTKLSLQLSKTYPQSTKAIAARYAAIEQVVKDLCKETK